MKLRKIFFILSLISLYGLNLSAQNFTRHTITTSFIKSKKLDVADIDKDGDLDIVAAANDGTGTPVNVAWFENDGDENFTQHDLDTNFPGARVAIAADLIPGGYLEVVAGNLDSDAIRMYEYDSQFGTWSSTGIGTSAQFNFSVRAVDVDEDGDLDLLATYGPTQNIITWFENNGSGSFTEHLPVTSTYTNAADATIGDVDGDGILDIFGIAFIGPPDIPDAENVKWWKGDGTPANGGWTDFLVDQHPGWPNGLDLVDLDQDDDLDAIVATWYGESVTWYENDGSGNFTQQPDVVNNFAKARNAIAADVDGDGDLDVVAAADDDNEVSWFENDGNQNWTSHIISTSVIYAYYAYPVDLEGDGDVDVATSAQDGDEIAWWENDLDDDQILASGSIGPTSFWNGNVTIDFTTNPTSGLVTVFYNAGFTPDPNSLDFGIVDHVAQKGYYTITTKKTGYTANIDFYYGAGNVNEWSNITNPDELVICLWDETNSQWEIAGSNQTPDAGNQKITVEGLTTELKPFSKWTLGSRTADNPLPVQLLAFTANSVREGVQLEWSTASEINNLGFEIWRSSQPDTGYTLKSSYLTNENLQGAGNSSQTIDYQFVDADVQKNTTYYYQLVDVDFNNLKTFHGPIEVTYSTETLLARTYRLEQNFPNPFNGVTNIPVYIAGEVQNSHHSVRLTIYDITGREMRSFNLSGIGHGLHVIEWDGRDRFQQTVASGVYLYSLFADGKMQSKRLQFIK